MSSILWFLGGICAIGGAALGLQGWAEGEHDTIQAHFDAKLEAVDGDAEARVWARVYPYLQRIEKGDLESKERMDRIDARIESGLRDIKAELRDINIRALASDGND